MATPTTTNRFLIEIGDGADPETFAFPCGANSRSVTLTNNLGEDTLLDCDNPMDVPAIVVRYIESQDTVVSISGRVAKENFAMWRAFADELEPRNIKITLDEPLANGGGSWIVKAYLGSFELGGEGSASATFSATLSGTGQRVWTPAAA